MTLPQMEEDRISISDVSDYNPQEVEEEEEDEEVEEVKPQKKIRGIPVKSFKPLTPSTGIKSLGMKRSSLGMMPISAGNSSFGKSAHLKPLVMRTKSDMNLPKFKVCSYYYSEIIKRFGLALTIGSLVH